MPSKHLIFLPVISSLFLFVLAAAGDAATELNLAGRLQLGQGQAFPAIKLRGYGTLSGSLWNAPGAGASILRIQCEDVARAKLVVAKYLSDFGLLPGITPLALNTKIGRLTGRRAEGLGAVVAIRSGAEVLILAAAHPADLPSLAEDLPAGLKIDATEPEVHVPMYLDRWDKYGLRFYYGPFVKPRGPNGRDAPDYDQTQDFDFAERSGHAGLVMWENGNGQDTAEGIMDTPKWSWVLDAAKKRELPIGVNFGMQQICWMFNRQRDQQLQGQPQYLGGWYGLLPFSPMLLSWNAAIAEEQALVQLQRTVRRFNDVDNIVSWMEPHEEMGHGAADVFVDYGPQADIGYREFLQSKYGSLDVVARRWGSELRAWGDVHVPELASFLGWNKDAVDLTGVWHISFQSPYDASSAAPQLDDSAWPTIVAPGNPIALYLPRSPAVYRRHIHIDPAWRAAHKHVWLYVWDLNDNRGLGNAGWHYPPGKFFSVYVNGKELTDAREHKEEGHWSAVDVSSVLTAGDNLVTVLLPWGFFDYRAYVSPHPPQQYPALGPQMNARWVDFSDWNSWCRGQAVRRGVRMIRQVDPNRPITLASPDSYMSEMKAIGEDYGGLFHNTGYMAGFWANWHCLYMANSGLATDVEPGSGAVDLPDFKRFMGRWSTEGVQGVDYFQHVGDILWNEPIRDYFQQTLNLWHLLGKYHTPKAEAAALISDRVGRLTGFPWHPDPAIVQRGGIVPVRLNEWLLDSFPIEAVVENDFARGNVDSYRVVVDTNTTIMDEPLIGEIEKWVRGGGIFVALGQSGRHTSTAIDSWPIAQLTGYSVVRTEVGNSALSLAPHQPVFKDDYWAKVHRASGLALKKAEPECQDLMLWDDGTTAMGMRPLGKGFVIDLGATPEAPRLLREILTWAGLQTVPATVAAKDVLMRHFVSNNGLYDVWAMWNQKDAPLTTDLVFRNGRHPTTAIDVRTGAAVAVESDAEGAKIPLRFDNWETRVFLTPRPAIARSASEWFDLQRHWWKGTTDPGTAAAPFKARNALPLDSDWAFHALAPVPHGGQPPDADAWAAPQLDDSAWPRQYLGVLNAVNHPGVKHAIFRKHFTVPEKWKDGTVILWAEIGPGNGRLFLDGTLQPRGIEKGGDLTEALKSGGAHVLAFEVWGEQAVFGPQGTAWIAFRPTPAFHQDLSGEWEVSTDVLTHTTMHLPGKWDASTARRSVDIDAAQAERNVVVRVAASQQAVPFVGVIVNGHLVTHIERNIEMQFNLNVTPYVKFGQKNEFILTGRRHIGVLSEIAIDYYDKNAYP
jgi:hypothetical protein